MTKKLLLTGVLAIVLIPVQANAYFTPEQVLLSKEFFLPPTTRESGDRIQRQVERSRERRIREQDLIFAAQARPEPLIASDDDMLDGLLGEDDILRAAAPNLGGLDERDLRLLQTIKLLDTRESRLLDRVNSNQQILQYYGARPAFLHGGAPPLAPTGAGGILSALTMLGAVGWTIRKAKNSEGNTRV